MGLFFKKDDNIDKKAVSIAFVVTFFVWGVLLLVNSASEFNGNDPVLHSFTVLVIGLIAFFLTEMIATATRKSQASK